MSALDVLADKQRWIAWRSENRNGKPTKVPYSPHGGRAKTDDPATWGSRSEAEATAKELINGSGGGIGIQLGDLGDGDVLAGIDLDACIAEDGTIAPWAAGILTAVPTYAENSPSDRGIKMFFFVDSAAVRPFLDRIGVSSNSWGCRRGIPGEDSRDHGPAIEIYTNKRYFTVTGEKCPNASDNIVKLGEEELERFAGLVPDPKSKSNNTSGGDDSRSACAFRIGREMRAAGKSFDEFCEAVSTDATTASWYTEKGIVNENRELIRIWEKACPEGYGLDIVRVSDIEAQPIRWLWPGRIARGKVTILAGDPGLGKSQVTLAIAGIVSTGGAFPVSGEQAERGSVLILSAEDDAADTIRPRLEAAGADLNRCRILRAVRPKPGEKEGARSFSLDRDLPLLEKALGEFEDVKLVIIDPLTAYLGRTDSHKNAQVRALLAPLGELATRCGVAILAVLHLSKARDGDAITRVSGSMAFVAAARAAFMFLRDPDDGDRRLMLSLKNNLGDDRTGYACRVDDVTLPNGIETSEIVWEPEAVTTTIEEIMSSRSDIKRGDKLLPGEKLMLAAIWLRAQLEGGPVPARDIEERAKAAGHSSATMRRAKDDAGVVSEKAGFGGGWVWRLPGDGDNADGSDPALADAKAPAPAT